MPQTDRSNWPLIITLWIAGLFAAAQFGKISLQLQSFAIHYGTDLAGISPAVSLVGTVGILFGVMAGTLAARFGLRRALITAMIVGTLISLYQASLPSLPFLYASRILEGFAHLTIVVAAPSLIVDAAAPRHKSVAMGLWGTFFGVSFALTALILPTLTPLGLPTAALIAHGIGFAAITALLAVLLPPVRPIPARIRFIGEHRAIYSNPRLILPAAGFFWHTLMFVALLTFMPGLLPQLGWVTATLPLISLAGTFGAGVLARWIAPDRIILASFALSLCLLALGPTQLWVALPLFFTVGLAPGACFAAMPYFNTERADIARASGAIAQVGNLGTTSGTPLYALVLTGYGAGGVTLLTALLCALGILSVFFMRRAIG